MKRFFLLIVGTLLVAAIAVAYQRSSDSAAAARPVSPSAPQHAVPASARDVTFACAVEDENVCDYFWDTFQEDAGMKDPAALRVHHVTLDMGCVKFDTDRCSQEKAVAGLLTTDGVPTSVMEVGLGSPLIATVAHKAADAAYEKKETP